VPRAIKAALAGESGWRAPQSFGARLPFLRCATLQILFLFLRKICKSGRAADREDTGSVWLNLWSLLDLPRAFAPRHFDWHTACNYTSHSGEVTARER
jgi:hypothetical protein